MDPIDRAVLQSEISKLIEKAYKDIQVLALLNDAQSHMKARRWTQAQEKYEQAKKLFAPPRSVADILLEAKAASTKAAAHRLIQSGVVRVGARVVRRVGEKVDPKLLVFVGERQVWPDVQ